jgi:nucleoside-diphosphate-sugar epimerase
MKARKQVFVTGGAGFLGRRVLAALVRDGWQVRALVRSAAGRSALRSSLSSTDAAAIEVLEGDLQNLSTYTAAMAGCDTLLHMAAAGGGGAASLFSDNVAASRRLLTAAAHARVQRIVLVSSFSVYQTSHLKRGAVLDEKCPLESNPERRDAYAFSKLAQEQICRELANEAGIPLAIVRPAVIYGPARGVLSSRVGLSFAGVTFRFGSRRALPYTYVDNCADAIARCVAAPPHVCGPFNIVDDELPTPTAIVRAVRRAGMPLRSVGVPLWAMKLGVRAYDAIARHSDGMLPPVLTPYRADAQWKPLRYSNAAAKRELGWQPAVPLRDALVRSLASPGAGAV